MIWKSIVSTPCDRTGFCALVRNVWFCSQDG